LRQFLPGDDLVAPGVEQGLVVGDGKDAGAVSGGVVANHADEGGGGGGVEHGSHLVTQQVAGLDGEGAGEAGALELAFADFVWAAVEEFGVEPRAFREFWGGVGAVGGVGDDAAQGVPGVDGLAWLLELPQPVPVLVVSAHIEVGSATELLTIAPGGVGYLLKDRVVDVADFLDAVDRVAGGGVVVDPEVMREPIGARAVTRVLDRLTPRERAVLALMAQGRTNANIAAELVVSMAAVEKHIGNVFMKLDLPPDCDAHRRVAAVLTYLQAL